MAEHLVAQQFLGKGPAVDGEQRPLVAAAALVDKAGHQLLAGPRFAGQHDIAVSGGHLPGRIQELFHLRVGADQLGAGLVVLQLLAQLAVFLFQMLLFQGLLDHLADFIDLVGLGDVMVSAGLHGIDGRIDRGVAGDHDDLGYRAVFLRKFQDIHAVDLFHLQVGENQVEPLVLDQRQGLGAVLQGGDLIALILENVGEVFQGDLFVVDDEKPGNVTHLCFPVSWGARW